MIGDWGCASAGAERGGGVKDPLVALGQAAQALAEAHEPEQTARVLRLLQGLSSAMRRMGLATAAVNQAVGWQLCAGMQLADQVDAEQQAGKFRHGGNRTQSAESAPCLPVAKERLREWRVLRDGYGRERVWTAVAEANDDDRRLSPDALIRQARTRLDAKHVEQVATAPSPGGWVRDLHELVATGERFGTIVSDPPWPYSNRGTRGAAARGTKSGARQAYETPTMEEIAAEPVGALAADDAHLHLWTTVAFLPQALDLIGKWGSQRLAEARQLPPRRGDPAPRARRQRDGRKRESPCSPPGSCAAAARKTARGRPRSKSGGAARCPREGDPLPHRCPRALGDDPSAQHRPSPDRSSVPPPISRMWQSLQASGFLLRWNAWRPAGAPTSASVLTP